MEAKASHTGKYSIPDDWTDSFLMKKLQLSLRDIRETPEYIIQQILFQFHLDNIINERNSKT